MSTLMNDEATEIRCECGEWTGVRCNRVGPEAQAVLIEGVPEWQRQSHVAAGRRTTWMGAGERVRVSRACADQILAHESEWVREIAPKISWRDVPLTVASGGREEEIGRGARERARLMDEYRRTGAIEGAFLATLDDLNATADDGGETADLGPSRDEIDWTGLDEARG